MATEYGLQAQAFILYDGTNSAEVLAVVTSYWGSDAFIVSETSGILTVSSGSTINDPKAIAVGERFGPAYWGAVSASDWALKFVKA